MTLTKEIPRMLGAVFLRVVVTSFMQGALGSTATGTGSIGEMLAS